LINKKKIIKFCYFNIIMRCDPKLISVSNGVIVLIYYV